MWTFCILVKEFVPSHYWSAAWPLTKHRPSPLTQTHTSLHRLLSSRSTLTERNGDISGGPWGLTFDLSYLGLKPWFTVTVQPSWLTPNSETSWRDRVERLNFSFSVAQVHCLPHTEQKEMKNKKHILHRCHLLYDSAQSTEPMGWIHSLNMCHLIQPKLRMQQCRLKACGRLSLAMVWGAGQRNHGLTEVEMCQTGRCWLKGRSNRNPP